LLAVSLLHSRPLHGSPATTRSPALERGRVGFRFTIPRGLHLLDAPLRLRMSRSSALAV
jgi:hypothetical protein